jgi:hypothetical protein
MLLRAIAHVDNAHLRSGVDNVNIVRAKMLTPAETALSTLGVGEVFVRGVTADARFPGQDNGRLRPRKLLITNRKPSL